MRFKRKRRVKKEAMVWGLSNTNNAIAINWDREILRGVCVLSLTCLLEMQVQMLSNNCIYDAGTSEGSLGGRYKLRGGGWSGRRGITSKGN